MAGPTKTSPIASVGTTFVTVSSQGEAIRFYCEVLGFELRSDRRYGEGMRWVEAAPPGADTVIALNTPMAPDDKPGGDLGFGYHVEDFDAGYAELRDRGVKLEEPVRMPAPVPPMAWFSDPDGNRSLIVPRAN